MRKEIISNLGEKVLGLLPGTTRGRVLIGITGICVLLLLAPCCAPPPKARPIVDEDGRVVIYHGINICNYSKKSPERLPWHTQEDFAKLQDWGFNLVRYLVFWEAIEPERDHFDENYIAATLTRIRWLEELGIDVIVDLHQDLYCQRFTGNGFPDWTVDDDGHLFTPREPWNLNYAEPAVRAAYRNFWESEDLQHRYVNMCDYLLSHIDPLSNVVGLEMMNEPWPSGLLTFEATTLTNFYTRIQTMKGLGGYHCPLYFEPTIYTSAGVGTRLRYAPDLEDVYAVHYYDPLCHENRPYHFYNRWWMGFAVRQKVREAEAFGTPMILSEFGISPKVQNYGRYLNDLLNYLETYQVSWSYYSYDRATHSGFAILDESGSPRALLNHLIQVYAQRIAGRAIAIRREETRFQLAFDPVPCEAPTLIFIPDNLAEVQIEINGEQVEYIPEQRLYPHQHGSDTTRQEITITWR